MLDEVTFTVEDVVCSKETDKALLCNIDDDLVWIPKSQVHDTSEVWKEGQTGDLVVKRWFAEQRGWL